MPDSQRSVALASVALRKTQQRKVPIVESESVQRNKRDLRTSTPPLGTAKAWLRGPAEPTAASRAATVPAMLAVKANTTPALTPTRTPTPAPTRTPAVASQVAADLILEVETPSSGLSIKAEAFDDSDLELQIPVVAPEPPSATKLAMARAAPAPPLELELITEPEPAPPSSSSSSSSSREGRASTLSHPDLVVATPTPTPSPVAFANPTPTPIPTSVREPSSPGALSLASSAVAVRPVRAPRDRRAMLVGAGALALVAVAVTAKVVRASQAIAVSAPAAAAFGAVGFHGTTPSIWSPGVVEENVPAGSCVVALGVSGDGPIPIEVAHNGQSTTANGSVGFCTCANQTVVVSARGGTGPRSVRLVRTDASAFGGVLGFAMSPAKAAIVEPSPCSDEHADAWLEATKRDDRPAEHAATRAFAAFANRGFEHLASAPAAMPLVPIAITANSCSVIVSDDDKDLLSLRVTGGARVIPLGRGAIAACSSTPRTLSVWHEGKGVLTVMRGDASRVGGRRGIRGIAAESGRSLRGWTDASDLAWDAALALASIGASAVQSMPWTAPVRTPQDTRVVALGFDVAPPSFAVPPGATCDGTAASNVVLCAQNGSQVWSTGTNVGTGAIAYATVPFWLKVVASTNDASEAPRTAMLSMMGLASRLRAAGFDVSVLEGVTETHAGADVLGRAGENAVVAVTVQGKAPWVLPLSTDHVAWSIEGAPRIVPIAPGQRVSLVAPTLPIGASEARRTVVFRRSAEAPAK